MKKLKIAIFCTNEWKTPPPQDTFYAPLWVAYYTAEELAKKGHKVFYFGSSESKLKYAKLVSGGMPAVKYNDDLKSFTRSSLNEAAVNFYEQLMISDLYRMNFREKFDIIHIHPYRRCIPFAKLTETPTVITLHDPIEGFNKYMLSQTKKIPQIRLISISNSQRKPLPGLNYAATVYNGIDLKKFAFNPEPEDYFAVAGRFVPEKGIDLAVKAAAKTKVRLKLAGGPARGRYWEEKIKPFLGGKIEYAGMLDYYKMGDFYGKAKALLHPQRWQEPFGLVMVEAMACGTPVISLDNGSAREIINSGKTGFVVKNPSELAGAIKRIDGIKREDCRKWVEKNFTIEKMAEGYEKAFYRILKEN